LGFGGFEPEATGRPAYHPATLLKIYVYGYLNRVQSSRRLERACQRNIELVWLTGRLMPDFKTIADVRKDNGEAIRKVCRKFVVLCRRLELLSDAIDGSKFKAVNTRDRNFTQAKMQRQLAQIDESIARYISQLDSADRQGKAVPEAKISRLKEKIAALLQEIQCLNGLNTLMMQTEDKQISLTDPDARSMATSGRGSGMVGYKGQSAVDTKPRLIVAHEVSNVGSDRGQLSDMTERARAAISSEAIEAVADRGYYRGEEIVACEQAGITVYLPKPMTSDRSLRWRNIDPDTFEARDKNGAVVERGHRDSKPCGTATTRAPVSRREWRDWRRASASSLAGPQSGALPPWPRIGPAGGAH
jgi:transposase